MFEFVSPLAVLGTTLFMLAVQHLLFSRVLLGRYLGTAVPEIRTPKELGILGVTIFTLLLLSTNIVMYIVTQSPTALTEVVATLVLSALTVLALLAQWTRLSLRQLGIYACALTVLLAGGLYMILFWPW